jgi:hypothetical protein
MPHLGSILLHSASGDGYNARPLLSTMRRRRNRSGLLAFTALK